ncbi:carboxypeptidase regulatory-like domain-containing protein [Tunturiibacter empetritectus]|uniref:Tetratricopeptide (TPR) repeat protein n=1 Tax=Tunturiibacter lichenicola TaxID=2051959 RepID=A0A852VBE4_9BACT|nr:carboxypeptidase regulatory-like domain-containing protein [Edaphobacter lichenicola]NYF90213.1 tetratricopeptide (TPR) repeat protein [Edaphobacter lichenicola]
MKNPTNNLFETSAANSPRVISRELLSHAKMGAASWVRGVLVAVAVLLFVVSLDLAFAQQISADVTGVVQGTVHSPNGKPVDGAVVRLEQKGAHAGIEIQTNADGTFAFSPIQPGIYRLSAEKPGFRGRAVTVTPSSKGTQQKVDLVLEDGGSGQFTPGTNSSSSGQAMAFADKPNFTVAGVTDWTAVGGHGSDSMLRTSEALASETVTLKPWDQTGSIGTADAAPVRKEIEGKLRSELKHSPGSFEANHKLGEFYLRTGRYGESLAPLQNAYRINPENLKNQYDLILAYDRSGRTAAALDRVHELLKQHGNGKLYRLAGELDETSGNPLAAVHEYEEAVQLEPSEQNYFEWGSELLIHRAIWQAQEVFRRGNETYPRSARMLTALGAALFAGALYEEAAARLCHASDLDPMDSEPYMFMGKMQIVAPDILSCVEQRLARFVKEQPDNALANYFYAMAILKRQHYSEETQTMNQAEALLARAVSIDAKCGDAYLQLGILSASRSEFSEAIDFYKMAIEGEPQLGEAHYRLALAYDRVGERAKAEEEFKLHDEIKSQQAEAIEKKRREVKQFLIILPDQPVPSTAR